MYKKASRRNGGNAIYGWDMKPWRANSRAPVRKNRRKKRNKSEGRSNEPSGPGWGACQPATLDANLKLGELTGHEVIHANCRRCLRSSLINVRDVTSRLGEDTQLAKLIGRLVCRKCGERRPTLSLRQLAKANV